MNLQSLWMIVASALFACMGVCVKLGASLFSAAELVFYRGAIALAGLAGFVLLRRLALATPHWRAHLWRSLTGSASLLLYFYAISVLPLATAVTLNYTSPLFLALILAVWAGERVRAALYLALALGLAGVVLLLRPSFAAEQWLGGLAALASGAGAGVAYFNVRQLGRLGEPEWRTVFYFSLASTLIGLPWLRRANRCMT
jgi:drug/metabolite transporter (DMT)-like permease